MFNCSEYKEAGDAGKILIKIVFLKEMGNELRRMNKGDSLFTFLGYPYTFIRNYRMLEEPCRELKELVHHFPTADHSTIQRGIIGLDLNLERVDMSGNVLIVDSRDSS